MELSEKLKNLTPEQLELLRKKMQQKGTPRTASRIPKRNDPNRYPMSAAQKRLWFLEQLDSGSAFYNIPSAVRFSGPINPNVLEQAINSVVQRHDILRSYYVVSDSGEPEQQVDENVHVPLRRIDLSHLPQDDRASELRTQLSTIAATSFDLTQAPLLSTHLVKQGEHEHVLMINIHHIIADGWSVGVLLNEIVTLYKLDSDSNGGVLPEPELQFADYAEWLETRAAEADLEQQLQYWTSYLQGMPTVLELITDFPRPSVQTHKGKHHKFVLNPNVVQALRELARKHNTSLYNVLMAATQLFLQKYTQQDDFGVGAPIANRNRRDVESIVGFLVNTIVLRARFEKDIPFDDLVERVKNDVLNAAEHQDVPFEEIVETLEPHRQLSHSPLFQVMFDLQRAPFQTMTVDKVSMHVQDVDINIAKFDLLFLLLETGDDIECTIEYNVDLFKRETIQRCADYFAQLLSQIAAAPQRQVSELSLISPNTEKVIIRDWNATQTAYPRESTLHELFEETVQRYPEHVALQDGQTTISYQELNERVNRLAHYLSETGVTPGSFVALYLERTPELMIAVLAIIKAGACYVPLDLAYPAPRIEFMLHDTHAAVVLTDSLLAEKLPNTQAQIIELNRESETIAQQPSSNPGISTEPMSAAYVIYTSGSTGQPKGVVVPHRAVIRLVKNTNYIELGPVDVIPQISNAAFDAATFEFWGSMLNGTRLAFIPKDILLSPSEFVQTLRELNTSAFFITTAYFNQIVKEIPDAFASINTVMFGGEAVDASAVRAALKGTPPKHLVHVYGPTENTTFSTFFQVDHVDDTATNVPIGDPIANSTCYVIDKYNKICPPNVPGELLVGGDGVALGYHNRPELNAERFIDNPFDPESGPVYRTGDSVRYLSDGSIEFLDRIDQQVKIRGFRIELGEIEALLQQQESVQEAVVLAKENNLGEKQLVAYYVSSNGDATDAQHVKQVLSETLPEYMVPTFFVEIDTILINANGKVDKRALPDPVTDLDSRHTEYVAPRNKIETFLVDLWKDILGLETIGVYDNFFDLGGNSLKAAVFVNRLQKEFNETVHVASIFKAPSVAEFALFAAEYYKDTIKTRLGDDALEEARYNIKVEDDLQKIDDSQVQAFQNIIHPLPDREIDVPGKNPPAIFVLSPPRSGSTLLRVMLAGNKRLFSPPELDLLSFNTLQERKEAFSDEGLEIWLQAPIRAIMELKGMEAQQAAQLMHQYEARNLSVKEFYAELQKMLGDRLLVDKTPTYPFNPHILQRAETDFDNALYVHLVRHPYAMIYSFIEAKLDQNFFRYEHNFTRRQLAELIWIVSNRNILDFLETIPEERQYNLRFEDLLHDPQHELQPLCQFLNIDFEPDMLEPYKGKKMTDGVNKSTQMVGDFKFYLHKNINSGVADRWRKFHNSDFLSDLAWELAARFDYPVEKDLVAQRVERASEQLEEIKPIPRDAELPLSYAQQRLWFLDQFEPGNPQYNIPASVLMTGNVRLNLLETCLTYLIERHETLRTVFETSEEGKACQVILPHLDVKIPKIDLMELPESDREEQAQRIANAEASKQFDLRRGPLVRAKFIRLAEDKVILVLVMHHIISDGWSVNVLIRELATLYEQMYHNQDMELPDLAVQYVDFAAWQREWLSGERLQSQIDYWGDHLAGLPPVLELPTDFARPAVVTHNGRDLIFRLSPNVSRRVKEFSRKHGATDFMTLMAAFQVLLARYANQTDIAVGTPIANRTRNEVEPLIGFFVNTLVIRGRLEENPTFKEFIAQLKNTSTDAYQNQDVPFEKLVDLLQPERNTNHTPLFQVMFAFQDSAIEQIKLSAMNLSVFQITSSASKFDLSVSMVERDGQFRGQFEYNADLFKDSTILRMVRLYEQLLDQLTQEPEQRVLNVPWLPDSVRHQVVSGFNRSHVDLPDLVTVPSVFEQQVAATPNAMAVSDGNAQLTFQELNERANRVAHYLISQGVKAETFVGICMLRSVDSVVAIFAVLKAGGTYLPLDPDYPRERLEFIFQDTQLDYLITQESIINQLPITNQHVFYIDTDWQNVEELPDKNTDTVISPEQIAYVIYTSGSTGRPKGVMISHRSAYNLLVGLETSIYSQLEQGALRTSLNAPLLFDASVQELVTLLRGHNLCIIPAEVRTDGDALLKYIVEHRIDVLDCVPSQLKLLLQAGLFESSEWIPQAILPGGEAIDESTWTILRENKRSQIFNMYGPTECTVDATTCWVNQSEERPNIGTPLANAHVYILDRFQQPIPVGVVGEICIGGAGVARGYLNRPELTADKFIPNPFGNAGERLYRTGDLGRFLPTGEIEFLGRLDFQVKLRGYRMELGEIEAHLNSHSAIKESVVLVREDSGEQKLVAYYIPIAEKTTVSKLREHLLERLPDYMVPAFFIALEAFPLTPNGKLDRKALPAPQVDREDLGSEFAQANTEYEKILAEIWSQVLGVEEIGIDDNFFALGGDSILSIQVITRAKQRGLSLSPKDVFEQPTVRGLAARAGAAPVIRAEQGRVSGEVPLTPIQQAFFERQLENPHHYNQALLLDVQEPLDPDLLQQTLKQLIDHHDALRLQFKFSQNRWHATFDNLIERVPFDNVNLSTVPLEELDEQLEHAVRKAQESLNIEHGPLLRMTYVRLPESHSDRLHIVCHHLVIDGVSWRIFLEDFQNIYQRLSNSQSVQMPLKTSSIQEWSEALQTYAASETLWEEIDYWQQLAQHTAHDLPTDAKNGSNTEGDAVTFQTSLDADLTDALLRDVPSAYNTQITEVLLTALADAVKHWTGHHEMWVSLEGHGREPISETVDVSRTIGWFTSLYPVYVELPEQPQWSERLNTIKRQVRAVPVKGIGYGVLRYLAQDKVRQAMAAVPHPPMVFNYLGQFENESHGAFSVRPAAEAGPERAAENERQHLLDFSANVHNGEFHLYIMYSSQLFQADTIESLAHGFMDALKEIIRGCQDNTVQYSAADFEDVDLDEDEFDNLIAELSENQDDD